MNLIAAMMILASSATAAPNYERDMDAFIKFMWAYERCPGVAINYDKTLEQVTDLGGALGWSEERTRDKILVESRIAEFEYQQDQSAFCDASRALYRTYNPSELRRVGVLD